MFKQKAKFNKKIFIRNILAGFTVSFFTLSLGAVFGLMTERGIFTGLISAALIAVITSIFSSTKTQVSTPTGPMTATLIAISSQAEKINIEGITTAQFINFSILMAGIFLIIAAIFKLNKIIKAIPNIIVSGFMTGVGVLIAYKEIKFLFGLSGTNQIEGNLALNLLLVLITLGLFLCFYLSKILDKNKILKHIPPTLIAIIILTLLSYLFKIDQEIALSNIGNSANLSGALDLLKNQLPNKITFELILAALPISLELTLIAFIDTLLTAIIVEKKTKNKSSKEKDLVAQGLSTAAIATIGGVPGAQSTVPSIMIIKEGGSTKIASLSLAFFSVIGIFVLGDFISLIPQAIFVGIILKISYNVMDLTPFKLYLQKKSVNLKQIILLVVVILTTAFINLNTAIIGGSTFFYLQKRFSKKAFKDLKLEEESEGYLDEL